MKTDRLSVSLLFHETPQKVGELVADGKKIYFKYEEQFLLSNLSISPFKLPANNIIVSANLIPFDGLFGVFNDSLPDGWGRLLLDRTLTSKGYNVFDVSPMDRLAFVGKKGAGALIYEPIFENEFEANTVIDLDYIASEMNHVLDGESTDILDELFEFGGSSGGARPKINVGYHPIKQHLIPEVLVLPEGYEHWLIKFPSSYDRIDAAQIEYAYSHMALEAGIEMAPCKLFKGKSGRYYFGTKRFDRIDNNRLHAHTASGLLHDDFRMSTMDYGHLMDAAFQLEKHIGAYEKVLQLATFNLYSHNRDDHSKNFSFLMNPEGKWQFAPAYDLTFSNSSLRGHSTSIAGEYNAPAKTHLLELATTFGMKKPEIIIEKVQDAIANWKKHATESGVTASSMAVIEKTMGKLLML